MERQLTLLPTPSKRKPDATPCPHHWNETEIAGPLYRTLGIGEVHIEAWCDLCGLVAPIAVEFWKHGENGWRKM